MLKVYIEYCVLEEWQNCIFVMNSLVCRVRCRDEHLNSSRIENVCPTSAKNPPSALYKTVHHTSLRLARFAALDKDTWVQRGFVVAHVARVAQVIKWPRKMGFQETLFFFFFSAVLISFSLPSFELHCWGTKALNFAWILKYFFTSRLEEWLFSLAC